MQIYPAIDITRGKVAHLSEDPVIVAERFLAEGATWLHVVDMDRAYETGGDNTAVVRRIARLPGASVQLGGLLRTTDQAREGWNAGVTRVVVATATLMDPPLLESLMTEAGSNRLAVAIDVRRGSPVLRGSNAPVRETAADLARRARDAGVETIVYRDVDRDGQLAGFDADGAAALLPTGATVIVAGGGASLDDLRSAMAAGLAGAIVGRALYDCRFTLREAIACSRS